MEREDGAGNKRPAKRNYLLRIIYWMLALRKVPMLAHPVTKISADMVGHAVYQGILEVFKVLGLYRPEGPVGQASRIAPPAPGAAAHGSREACKTG
jgi:hypothetical protein